MTKVIGLTGGIGSGKSTIAKILGEMGAVVLDADKIGHEAFMPGTELWQEVVAAFGKDIVGSNGEIDRQKLGSIVFNEPEARTRLNSIMHPRMYEAAEAKIDENRRQGAKVIVLEAALLIEAHWEPLVDEVWAVVVSEETSIERLQAQRGLSREEILSRIKSQLPNAERIKHAGVVIDNDSDLEIVRQELKKQYDRVAGGG